MASGVPIASTRATTGSNSPPGSHACHSRKGSAIFAAAKSTHARVTQLMTVPK